MSRARDQPRDCVRLAGPVSASGHDVQAIVERPFAAATRPNAVWCVDFKGWFRTADGRRCCPLTLLDAYSRYLLRCEALLEPDPEQVQPIFDSPRSNRAGQAAQNGRQERFHRTLA